ncbi:translation initiation factor Sui1 [Parahaliea mediterranea]|uniref:translation initiation factor Sui1 n=1 Tax=Parahaliea mediterranea TaxID=651086 RepID=UPI000E2F488A|nr:translation initiation factor Sui1 [Parahaliea mediterranea]
MAKSGKNRDRGSALVYSTDVGRRCPQCARPVADCVCGKDRPAYVGDGVVRIQRETKGRGGKAVTVVRGLPLAGAELKALAKTLKQHCGVGGAVKEGDIEIQGDQRNAIKAKLESLGHTVKLSGG